MRLPKYCHRNRGFVRFRRGDFSTYLTGVPWSKDFMRQYFDALNGIKRQRRRLIDDFWDYVDKSNGPNSCWPWTRHIDSLGYGRAVPRNKGHSPLSHRHAWTFSNGKIPKGLHVLHSCDNPKCCNPAHLFLGTHQDNMKDRNKKRRFFAVLTEEKVKAIRRQYASGITQSTLAKQFRVSPSNISLICSRVNWSDV